MNTLIIVVLLSAGRASALSCAEVREQPDDTVYSLAALQGLPAAGLVECLAHLTKEKLPLEAAEFIWRTLVRHFDGADKVPESVMVLLHWATPAVAVEDYQNITLDNIDVIQNFGLDYELSAEQLAALAERVREDFAGKEPEDYTFYDLTALRQILCAFNRSEIERIRPSVYREAATVVGKLTRCPDQVMVAFAELAMQSSAFGDPNLWTDATTETVGVVANYLPKKKVANRT